MSIVIVYQSGEDVCVTYTGPVLKYSVGKADQDDWDLVFKPTVLIEDPSAKEGSTLHGLKSSGALVSTSLDAVFEYDVSMSVPTHFLASNIGTGGYPINQFTTPSSSRTDVHLSQLGSLHLPVSKFDPRLGDQTTLWWTANECRDGKWFKATYIDALKNQKAHEAHVIDIIDNFVWDKAAVTLQDVPPPLMVKKGNLKSQVQHLAGYFLLSLIHIANDFPIAPGPDEGDISLSRFFDDIDEHVELVSVSKSTRRKTANGSKGGPQQPPKKGEP